MNFTKRASSIPFFSYSEMGKIARSLKSVSNENRISVCDSASQRNSSMTFCFSIVKLLLFKTSLMTLKSWSYVNLSGSCLNTRLYNSSRTSISFNLLTNRLFSYNLSLITSAVPI